MKTPEIQNFINNEFVAPQEKKYLDNFNPATGKVYSKVADSSAVDVAAAVVSAKKAFAGWSKKTAEERAEYLYKKFLEVIEFKPDQDIVKIEDGWVKVYKFWASYNIKLASKMSQPEMTQEDIDNLEDEND